MSATQTASWFLKAAAVFVLTYALCWIAPRAFNGVPNLPGTTIDREQASVFDRYFRRTTPTVAILGSSLASRLREEYFQSADIENAALAGGSPLTGMEIIERASKPKPQIIVVEINILSRGVDTALIERYQGSTSSAEPLRPFRTLAAFFEPKPALPHPIDAAGRDKILRASPNPTPPALTKLVVDAVVDFGKVSYDTVIRRDAATFKTLVEKLKDDGVKVFLVELPMSPEISRTRYFETERSEIAKLFDPGDLLSLNYTDDLRWDDGLHLDERSALIVAGAIEQALTLKLAQSQAAR